MIQLNNLTTGYSKNQPILQDFDYVFEDNKIYCILGESGCGKTTLLRTISGLTKPLSGEILVDGVKVGKPNRNSIYMMHQSYTCFDWLNCLDNVLISKRVKRKVSKIDIINAEEMLGKVHLLEHKTKFPRQLSGGMRQRLALARTLFTKPDILLMDEPLSALDSVTRTEMQELILNLHQSTGNTIIMVTHSPEEADKMCDIKILLEKEGTQHGKEHVGKDGIDKAYSIRGRLFSFFFVERDDSTS